jgi:hypothetical protein
VSNVATRNDVRDAVRTLTVRLAATGVFIIAAAVILDLASR